MPTYYCDAAAVGLNNGTSWADAWTVYSSSLAAPVAAGDTVLSRGTFALAGVMTHGVSGTAAAYIQHIGCNAAGVDDGTRVIFDGAGAAINLWAMASKSFILHKNFTFRRAQAGIFFTVGSSNGMIFLNCLAELMSSTGISGSGITCTGGRFVRGEIRNCTFSAANGANGMAYTDSMFHLNGIGIQADYVGAENCIFANNTGVGLQAGYSGYGLVQSRHNIFYNNGTGMRVVRAQTVSNSEYNKFISNGTAVLLDNATCLVQRRNGYFGNGAKYSIGVGSSVFDLEGNVDMLSHGLVDPAAGKFQNLSNSELKNLKTIINANNSVWESAGLPQEIAAAGGGGFGYGSHRRISKRAEGR